MDFSLFFYNVAAAGATLALPGAWLAGRLSGRWAALWPRVGLYRDLAPAPPGPRVWLQAVSVGEVGVAGAIAREIKDLNRSVHVTVTTSTDTGLAKARSELDGLARVAPFPLDMPWAVMAAAQKIRPHVYVSLETEIWPNLLAWLHSRGASLMMLNGRISPRSYPRYHRFRHLLAPTLRRFSRLSMITSADAQRIQDLMGGGGPTEVGGSAKYAGLSQRARPEMLAKPGALLDLQGRPLIAAGSVRSGEEAPVLDAFKQLLEAEPRAVLAIAPRHVEHSGNWLAACADRGLKAQAWTGLTVEKPRAPSTQVVVVDAMGELFGLYGLAKAAFVGASMVSKGGQNPMEPAAWGVPVVHGPSMEDFEDAKEALAENKASLLVNNHGELAKAWRECLTNGPGAEAMGRAARETAARESGTAKRAAELILIELERKAAI